METPTKIPVHIAKSVKNLYRECLRRAEFVGDKHGNREGIMRMVRYEFKKNINEKDPKKIQAMKETAATALFNHTLHEAGRMAKGQDDYEEPPELQKT